MQHFGTLMLLGNIANWCACLFGVGIGSRRALGCLR